MAKRWISTGKWSVEDTFALQALEPLGGAYLPWTGFALRPAAVMTVINELMLNRAASVLELGSGLSTVIAARFMRQCGPEGARIVSVDDNTEWLERVREYLERDGLTDLVELVHAPLVDWAPPDGADGAGGEFPLPERWYDPAPIRAAVGEAQVDFLLVDGPRAKRTIARYPALPELSRHLAPTATVVLDDANRPGEVEIVARWTGAFGFSFTTDRTSLAVGRRA
jgi:hypothetical protein